MLVRRDPKTRLMLLIAAVASVCSAQVPSSFSNDGAAKATQVAGRVSLEKERTQWAVQQGSFIQVNQVIVTGEDGFAVFQVSDGSTFEVYPNSRVTFRANPANWKDLLDVWLGRVKVHIQTLGNQPNPNRIRTPTAVISVRGTIFDVVVEEADSTLVSVEEGQVAVSHVTFPTKEPKLLNAGDNIRVYKDQPIARVSPNRDAIVQHTLKAAADAIYRAIYSPRSGGGLPGSGGGRPLPGDVEQAPPPPPPDTPPPPPGI